MKLSKSSVQAALAVGYLAERQDEGPIQAKQVGGYLGIPTDSALKILQSLARRKVINSRLGRGGGYSVDIRRGPISLLRIIEAVEGPITLDLAVEPTDDRQTEALDTLQSLCDHTARHLREQLARLDDRQMRPVEIKADSMPLYAEQLPEVA